MREQPNILNKLDWLTVSIYLALAFIGWISVYAATYSEEHSSIFDFSERYGKQLVWVLTGVLIAGFILLTDSKIYSTLAYVFYGATIFLLLLVLFAGTEVNGSRSWFIIGPVRLQPAELAKVATSLALAKLMSAYGFVFNRRSSLIKIALIIGLPVFFIFLQHDTGSALVFGAFILVLYREGLSGWLVGIVLFAIIIFILSIIWNPVSVVMFCAIVALLVFASQQHKIFKPFLIGAGIFTLYFLITKLLLPKINVDTIRPDFIFLALCTIAAIAGAVYAFKKKLRYVFYIILFFFGSIALSFSVDYVFDNVLKPHHRDRIEDLLGIKEDLQGAGYNVHQSKVAIGSGGFFGKGFLQGTQTKYNFVPEQSTDFIFCTIGEEWGFLGTLAVVILYLVLLFRLVIISERQKDAFARIYGYCVVSILFFHFAINIAMTIGLAPVIGIPLPFISYGGSSLWAFTILLFILLKLDMVRWK